MNKKLFACLTPLLLLASSIEIQASDSNNTTQASENTAVNPDPNTITPTPGTEGIFGQESNPTVGEEQSTPTASATPSIDVAPQELQIQESILPGNSDQIATLPETNTDNSDLDFKLKEIPSLPIGNSPSVNQENTISPDSDLQFPTVSGVNPAIQGEAQFVGNNSISEQSSQNVIPALETPSVTLENQVPITPDNVVSSLGTDSIELLPLPPVLNTDNPNQQDAVARENTATPIAQSAVVSANIPAQPIAQNPIASPSTLETNASTNAVTPVPPIQASAALTPAQTPVIPFDNGANFNPFPISGTTAGQEVQPQVPTSNIPPITPQPDVLPYGNEANLNYDPFFVQQQPTSTIQYPQQVDENNDLKRNYDSPLNQFSTSDSAINGQSQFSSKNYSASGYDNSFPNQSNWLEKQEDPTYLTTTEQPDNSPEKLVQEVTKNLQVEVNKNDEKIEILQIEVDELKKRIGLDDNSDLRPLQSDVIEKNGTDEDWIPLSVSDSNTEIDGSDINGDTKDTPNAEDDNTEIEIDSISSIKKDKAEKTEAADSEIEIDSISSIKKDKAEKTEAADEKNVSENDTSNAEDGSVRGMLSELIKKVDVIEEKIDQAQPSTTSEGASSTNPETPVTQNQVSTEPTPVTEVTSTTQPSTTNEVASSTNPETPVTEGKMQDYTQKFRDLLDNTFSSSAAQ